MDGRTSVLYVDDNPKSSRILAGVLEESGFRVTAKTDPAEALRLCRRSSFDLALIDYEMPAMSGARLAHEIRLLMPDLPVILISGRATLPPEEMEFADAHFGFRTGLDDLLWTMRILAAPQPVVSGHHGYRRANRRQIEHARSEQLGDHEFSACLRDENSLPEDVRAHSNSAPEPLSLMRYRWSDST